MFGPEGIPSHAAKPSSQGSPGDLLEALTHTAASKGERVRGAYPTLDFSVKEPFSQITYQSPRCSSDP